MVGAGAALATAVALMLLPGPVLDPGVAAAVPITPLASTCPARTAGTVEVAGVWSGPEARSFARVLEGYSRRTGLRVRYAYETHDIAAKLRARLRQGCSPDVAILPQPGLMADLARSGDLVRVDGIAGDLVRRSYAPAWQRLGTVDGHLYGVWFKAADKSTVWYRPAAFRKAGISGTPQTWDELLGAARRLRAAGITPLSIPGADGWTLTDWFENVYLRTAGPRAYDALAAHRIPWTDPTVVRALSLLGDLFADRSLSGSPQTALSTTLPDAVRAVFAPGSRTAMVAEGDFVRSFLPTGTAAGAARYFDFPGPRPAAATRVVGGDVAVLMRRSRGAARLLRYLATPEAAAPWASAGGFLSPNRDLALSQYPDALSRSLASRLAGAPSVRFDLSDLQPASFGATAETGMWPILQEFLSSPHDAASTARTLEAAASSAWACRAPASGSC